MSTERSDRVYGYWREASEKFDYFVTGAAVALVGYLGGTLDAVELELSPLGLQAAAAGAFLISAWAGFKRIEKNVTIFKVMHRRLYSEEAAGALMDAAQKGGPMVNTATGEVIDQLTAMNQAAFHKAGVEVTSEMLDGMITSSGRWYLARNWFLIGGLMLLVVSRILPGLCGVLGLSAANCG